MFYGIFFFWKNTGYGEKKPRIKEPKLIFRRIPKLLKEIENSCSDIIVLCEVTPPFLEKLLSETWVQKDYYISDHGTFFFILFFLIPFFEFLFEGFLPEFFFLGGITVSPYGQLILSKHPLTILNHTYSQFKRAIIGTW